MLSVVAGRLSNLSASFADTVNGLPETIASFASSLTVTSKVLSAFTLPVPMTLPFSSLTKTSVPSGASNVPLTMSFSGFLSACVSPADFSSTATTAVTFGVSVLLSGFVMVSSSTGDV